MRTSNLRSQVRKLVHVTTNDPRRASFSLTLRGWVQPVLDVQPTRLKLSGLADASKALGGTIQAGSELGITIESIVARAGRVQVVCERMEEGAGYRLELRCGPRDSPGVEQDVLEAQVLTSDGVTRRIELQVTIEHLGRVVVSPRDSVTFSREQTAVLWTDPRQIVEQNVFLDAATPDISFRVTGIEIVGAPEGLFTASAHPLADGRRIRIAVRVERTSSDALVRGSARIHTDDPGCPVVELRLFANFAGARAAPAEPAGKPPAGKPPASVTSPVSPPGQEPLSALEIQLPGIQLALERCVASSRSRAARAGRLAVLFPSIDRANWNNGDETPKT